MVNNLIDLFGRPDLIRVELAREVGKSKREREQIKADRSKQEKRRREAAADLRSNGVEPSRADVEKWLLWKECGEFDPYSGKPICFDDLFRTNVFDSEHIWPRSKCFDDSFANKTLCLKALNARKANRTPFEAFGNEAEWDRMKARVCALVANGKMKQGKAKRFCREEPLDEEFKSRQLNDTGFAARQALAFLKRLWPDVGIEAPVFVQAVTGRVTAQLRKLWELNNILSDDGEKTRADHRHHAVDALVVACVHPGITQKLSAYWQDRDNPASAARPRLDPPWENIRTDAEQAVGEIIVSHRVRKKVSGPLHNELPLGYTKRDITKNGKLLGIYVKRIPVEKLPLETLKVRNVGELSRTAKFFVCDNAVRTVLLDHLERANVAPAKAYPPYPRVSAHGPEIRKVRVLTVQQKELMVPVSKVRGAAGQPKKANGFADPASNHHIAIYLRPGERVDFEVVSLFEASRRVAKREPVVRRDRGDGASFVMSLSPGDALTFPAGDKKGIWIVGGTWANGQVVLERTNDATHATTTRPKPSVLVNQGARKIVIDPIGRIHLAND